LDFNAAVEQVFVKKAFDLGFASFCNGADPDIGVRRVLVAAFGNELRGDDGFGIAVLRQVEASQPDPVVCACWKWEPRASGWPRSS